jgi:hypothetical protein
MSRCMMAWIGPHRYETDAAKAFFHNELATKQLPR